MPNALARIAPMPATRRLELVSHSVEDIIEHLRRIATLGDVAAVTRMSHRVEAIERAVDGLEDAALAERHFAEARSLASL